MRKPHLKTITHFLKASYRTLNNTQGALPDFIIIGAQKSGTTSLHDYLAQHPELLESERKELHFFDGGLRPSVDVYAKGEKWYRAELPVRTEQNTTMKIFESTPSYIYNPAVPKRIHDMLPDAKLIAVLRNPTDRAISHFFHMRRRGRETLPILEALKREEVRLRDILANSDYSNLDFRTYSYKSRGEYHEQLLRYFELFSRDQILVISSDLLFSDTKEALRRVYSFLNVDTAFEAPYLNPRNISRDRNEVDTEVYEYLNNYFQPYNQKLFELLGEDFGW